MKVLWICNIMLPMVCEYLGREASNKEGWLTGLADTILKNQEENQIELAVAFPVKEPLEEQGFVVPVAGMEKGLTCYWFAEDTDHPEKYSCYLEIQIKKIVESWEPDVVHCFGTEFPHTLATIKIFPPSKVLIGIQGVCKYCADVYLADLPEEVINRVTFRDFLRKDSILQQKDKFIRRSVREEETLRSACHVTGRTRMDEQYAKSCNPEVKYYFMNETLRSNFYNAQWELSRCEKYSILLGQGDYPLKGLHYAIKAMPAILEQFPEAKLYVAGNPIVRAKNWKGRLKISSYGKYIMELLEKYRLEDKVIFLGKLTADEMKEQYLKSHLFVCTSAMENSSNSLGEAMLLGVPCVTAMVGGIPSVFWDKKDGIGYPGYGDAIYQETADKEQGQADKLAEAVCTMWSDEEKMKGYCQAAYMHACESHNAQANYQRLMEIYREIIGK